MSGTEGAAHRRIVVAGGYGAVGRIVAETLGDWLPGRVVVAGRDPGRVEAVVRARPGRLIGQRLDVERDEDVRAALQGASVVVMCVERANERIARACLERGVHYVDLSASASVLASIAALDGLARDRGAVAVLSVGLAPGLTNLLARHCVDRLPHASAVDIAVLLGLGEEHGAGAIEWTIDGLAAPGARGPSARVRLPGYGTRTAYPFPFSDQHTLPATLGVPATTRLCFDSAALTRLVFGLRAARLFAPLRHPRVAGALTRALSHLHAGSDAYLLHVAAGSGPRAVTATAAGRRQSHATAIVAADVARRLHSRPDVAGVRHLDQFVDPVPFFDVLADHGIAVTVDGDQHT